MVQAVSLAPCAGPVPDPARMHRRDAMAAPLRLASGHASPGAVRNHGAVGWEIPHVATDTHFCLLSTALLSSQEPPVAAALDAYQNLKGKMGFSI